MKSSQRNVISCLGSVAMCAVVSAQQPQFIPAGYRVETLATPAGVAFGVGGLSFAADGTLFCSTREGQVWTLHDEDWSLFARGLHEPLGILVTDERRVFVMQRPELTELIDEDGDGRADLYKTVCADWGLTDNYHEYAFGLVRDSHGNFYGTLNTTLSFKGWAGSSKWDIGRVHDGKMGRAARYRGWSFRVTPDGQFEPWSAGLRSPAGIGIGPGGELFYTDNQGDWNATSSLHHMTEGRFHGHPSSLMDHPDFEGVDLNTIPIEDYGALRTPPAVQLPHGELASSPGEPVLDTTGGSFGPFAGQLFIGDQTRSNVFRVVLDEVDGEYQGCAINFVDHLQCGVVRCRFGPDGSLYAGQTGRGWGSRGPKLYGLERIVWDGQTVPFALHSVKLRRDGFTVRFTRGVVVDAASDPSQWDVERWRYHYHPDYGSPKVDRTVVAVESADVSTDGVVVRLKLQLEPGFVYKIVPKFAGAEGDALVNRTAWYTLNRLLPAK